MTKPNKYCSNKEWLYDQYIIQKKSASQIAHEIECQQETVSRYLHKFDIPLRTQSEEIGGERHPMYGKHFSEESKLKMSIANTGHIVSDETKQKLSKRMSGSGNPRYGTIISTKQRQKQSKSMKRFYEENPEAKIILSKQKIEYNKQHPEAGQNHSKYLKQMYKDHPEIAEQQSITHKQRYIDHPLTEEEREERASHLRKFYEEHPEARTKHSKLMKVCNPSSRPEVAEKISTSLKCWHATHSQPKKSFWSIGGYFKKSDTESIWLRSTYETRYAHILKRSNIKWLYEEKAFYIPTIDATYRPDFYLPEYDIWIEIKGYMSEIDKIKLTEFYKVYPHEILFIVYGIHIEQLENCIAPFNICNFGIPLMEQVVLWKKEGKSKENKDNYETNNMLECE